MTEAKPVRKAAAKKAPAKSARTKAGTSKREAERRREIFAVEYVRNGCNATQAAVKAGFSNTGHGATVAGSRMLADTNVAARIKALQAELAKRHRLEAEDVIVELAAIARSDLRDFYDDKGRLIEPRLWPDHLARAVASIEYTKDGMKIRLWDKNSAIDKAMKHMGLFERDNKQKADPIAELMKHIAEHQQQLPVKP